MSHNGSKTLAIRSLALVAFCATLFSFSDKLGIDSFTIYLNDKLMLRENVRAEAGVKSFSLNLNSADDVLRIHYDHCGMLGSGRSISIQNDQRAVLKTWNFPDKDSKFMSVKVGEIPVAARAGAQKLYLVYSSNEIPKGRLLASVVASHGDKVSLK